MRGQSAYGPSQAALMECLAPSPEGFGAKAPGVEFMNGD